MNRTNAEIMGTILKSAVRKYDFDYVIYVLNCIKEDNIVVNNTFTDRLRKFKSKCKYRMKEIVSTNFHIVILFDNILYVCWLIWIL